MSKAIFEYEFSYGSDSGKILGFGDDKPLMVIKTHMNDSHCVVRNPEEFCRAIYTAANLEWPTAPDLGPLREALLDLRARWDANGTTVEEITYLLKVAEDMEIIPPAKPDPMWEVKEALRAIANDPCRSTAERQRAFSALDALS